MPYQLFHDLFPTTAEAETRTILLLDDDTDANTGLPAGHYQFCEMFCNEVGCDCRRVFFYVVSSIREGPVAVVAWGWETPRFYAEWLGDDDPQMIAELIGPTLNLGSPQTQLSEPILDLVREVLLRDDCYVERVKRHYQQFREKIDSEVAATKTRRKRKKKNKKRRKRK